jgi:hypothetical protein
MNFVSVVTNTLSHNEPFENPKDQFSKSSFYNVKAA